LLAEEKARLLALFGERDRWCQDSEAGSEMGQPVHYDDPCAVAWDITGGMCLLFGLQRALELFPQFDRHVHQVKRSRWWVTDSGIASMAALQDSNDDTSTTFEMMTGWVTNMPVRNRHHRRC
jgi:hypothetical protein